MRGYGVKRNWNAIEDAVFRNKTRKSARLHTKIKKALHRAGRRTAKNALKAGR